MKRSKLFLLLALPFMFAVSPAPVATHQNAATALPGLCEQMRHDTYQISYYNYYMEAYQSNGGDPFAADRYAERLATWAGEIAFIECQITYGIWEAD